MKLIISATSPKIDAQVDPRFGRAAHFIIIDADTLAWQAVPNPGINSSGGAGVLAAQFVADLECDAVISGDFGPNAYHTLETAGVPMYLLGSCRTPQEVIRQFKAGKLEQIDSSTEAHRRGHRHRG